LLDGCRNIVFFGGAGVSTESGIPDFRSGGGLYSESYGGAAPETILSNAYFFSHTAEFYEYYKKNIIHIDAAPNAAHMKLAELERAGRLAAVVTQNIDGLHQKAGSQNVIELHGSVYRNFCVKCGKTYDLTYVVEAGGAPYCGCGGVVRPDVVLYGENLDQGAIRRAVHYISRADALIIGGTSLVVYPAAGLVQYYGGDKLIIINKSETDRDAGARLVIRRGIAEVMDGVAIHACHREEHGDVAIHDFFI